MLSSHCWRIVCVCQGARATAEAQQLPHEVLTAAQAMKQFPGTGRWNWKAQWQRQLQVAAAAASINRSMLHLAA